MLEYYTEKRNYIHTTDTFAVSYGILQQNYN